MTGWVVVILAMVAAVASAGLVASLQETRFTRADLAEREAELVVMEAELGAMAVTLVEVLAENDRLNAGSLHRDTVFDQLVHTTATYGYLDELAETWTPGVTA